MTSTNGIKSPLLALPAELRNHIYALALTSSKPVNIDPAPAVLGEQSSGLIEGALIQTCSQIRNEATSIFYSTNSFRITGNPKKLSRAAKWLHGLEHTTSAASIPKLITEPFMFFAEPDQSATLSLPSGHPRPLISLVRWTRERATQDADMLVAAMQRSGLRAGVVSVTRVHEVLESGVLEENHYGRHVRERVAGWMQGEGAGEGDGGGK